jgi:hypothetical protein
VWCGRNKFRRGLICPVCCNRTSHSSHRLEVNGLCNDFTEKGAIGYLRIVLKKSRNFVWTKVIRHFYTTQPLIVTLREAYENKRSLLVLDDPDVV